MFLGLFILKNNTNIFDYCGQTKARGDWEFRFIHSARKLQEPYLSYTTEQKRDYLKNNGWEQSWDNDNWVRSDAEYKEANTGTTTDNAFFICIANPVVLSDVLQKTLRYMVTNKGGKIVKHNKKDHRNIQVESGKWVQTIFNTYKDRPFDFSSKFLFRF